MAQIEKISEYQASSMIVDDDDEKSAESSSCSVVSDRFEVFSGMRMLRLEDDSFEYEIVKKNFAVGMESAGVEAVKVVAIHKNLHSGWTRRARYETFRIFEKAVAQKCGGNANIIGYGWYGGSRDEICEILLHGFSGCTRSGSHGVGIHLFSNDYSFDG